MKRIALIGVLLCGLIQPLLAMHIKGGEMSYVYLGPGSGTNTAKYQLILKLYIDCNATSPGQLDTEVALTVFDKATGLQPTGSPFIASLANATRISFDPASNPCIGNPPTDVCYQVRTFGIIVTLPISAKGYTIGYQRCCRIANIVNLAPPSEAVGATYSCDIPGTDVIPTGYMNTSPVFGTNDATAICQGSSFTLSYSAYDADNDSLSYSFCNGYAGASQLTPSPTVSSTPPYDPLIYQNPYSGSSPLGRQVTIDPHTGLITGIAPNAVGQYVITVCAYEFRNGLLISIHRKDIHVKVSDCIPLKALLKPNYAYCDDFLVTFKNEQVNPPGSIYIWQYGDGSKADTSSDIIGNVQHQYADTGTYAVKLKVILAGQCNDSTVTLAKVYPGFFPGFTVTGSCILNAIQFLDTTKSRYGFPNKWSWTFGDETTNADTSHLFNPSWKYSTTGYKQVQLIVESSKGCIDTVKNDSVLVSDKPPIKLPFKDTLICSIDTLQLGATGTGIWSWQPNYNIINPNAVNPLVYPKTTTNYVVSLNQSGCINKDSISVRVVDFVTLNAGPDTTICLTDTTQLHPSGDGLKFLWSPAATIIDPNVKNPLVTPVTTTNYHVVASVGKCNASDNVTVRTVPYPGVNAGPDTAICYHDTAQLHAGIVASRFAWFPAITLTNPRSLNTRAFPLVTTTYILASYDTLGCPKPSLDSIIVNVHPKILAFAGNDTSVVVDQPLQMHGSGAELIEWQPPTYLNNNQLNNPIAVLGDNFTYVMKAYTSAGCFAYDTINIKVFKTAPDIFVPNAFIPGSSRNNLLRPIPVGIAQLEYFRVYNRWGQLVYQTSEFGKGWDGTIGGKAQPTETFVWMASGKDYTGKIVFRKGTAVLIR